MIRLRYYEDPDLHMQIHAVAVVEIVAVLRKRGYLISEFDAYRAWRDYSETFCAGWLYLPSDEDEIFAAITSRCYEEGLQSGSSSEVDPEGRGVSER